MAAIQPDNFILMELPPGYKGERIRPENFADFVKIHHEAFKSSIGIDFPEYKFNTLNLAGVNNLGYIIYYSGNIPVSFYGVYPVYAEINGEKVLVSQSGDTMTVPDHIGLGLFIHSANLTRDLCRENGIKGIFGFPSPPSFRTFSKKLNWKFNGKIQKFVFRVPAIPIGFFAVKTRFTRSIYLWWVRLILSVCSHPGIFEGSVTGNGQNGLVRDREFWNYKLASGDIFTIRILGKEVVLKTNGMLSIGDINIRKDDDIVPVLKKLKLLSILTFNVHLIFCLSPGTVLEKKLSVIKKGKETLPVGFFNLGEDHDISSLKFTYFDFDTF
jgi:hypothetical protein